ncbi:hypothetical protein OpiT1DRAFT_03808 [Opitutaceae bacterium TAV1]|nr:hypothetical protein OpiT1DRAFT_03808 [Opitutaceae bacterium TAV1]
MRGESIFPLEHTRFGRADRSAATADIDTQVRALLEDAVEVVSPSLTELARPRRGHGYSVDLAVHRLRGHGGEQALPNRVWFETAEDFLMFIGETERWHSLLADVAAISTAGPAFAEWAGKHARELRTRLKAGEGAALGAALGALHAKPHPGCFARELPLPGVSGKFIEENLALLADILREIGSSAWREGGSLHEQLGLRQTSRLLRLMDLNGSQLDYGLPLNRFIDLPPGVERMLIVENLRTFLTLPRLPGTLALFGEGHAVQTLSSHRWFAHVPITYWGDLDPTGFDILGRLRRVHPHVRSAMMDMATLTAHSSLLTKAAPVENPVFETLAPEESVAAARVQTAKQGIEQEKFPTDFIRSVLCPALS